MRKLMFLLSFLFISGSLLNVDSAIAEYYRYTDQSGVTRYTDDISQIPVDQRPKTKRFVETHSQTQAQTDTTSATTEVKEPKKGELLAHNKETFERLIKEKESIDSRQNDLKEEFKKLKAEEERITHSKPGNTGAAIKRYNKEKADIRKKVFDFNKRSDTLKKELDAYNAKVEAFNKLGEKVKAEAEKEASE